MRFSFMSMVGPASRLRRVRARRFADKGVARPGDGPAPCLALKRRRCPSRRKTKPDDLAPFGKRPEEAPC
jgi:hypothetical protein